MPASRPKPNLRRKNLILDQGKLDRVKEILDVETETEAVARALDAIMDLEAFRSELDTGLSNLVGKGGFTDRFRGRR